MSDENSIVLNEFEHRVSAAWKAFFSVIIGIVITISFAWGLGVPLKFMMDFFTNTWMYHFIPFFFSFVFLGLLVYKAIIKEIEGLKFLSAAVGVYGISEFIFMLSKPQGTVFSRGDNVWAIIGDLMFPIAVILLYFHIEFIEKQRPNMIHAVLILGTAVPLVGGEIAVLVLNSLGIDAFDTLQEEITKVVFVYLGVFSLIVIWISLFGFRIMYGTLKHADSPDIARASMFVLVGFASLMTNLALLGATYSKSIRHEPLLFAGAEFVVHNTWLLTMALLIMILAYILQPEFAFALPFDVYQVLVINAEMGITLFSFINEVREEGDMKHAALQSPAILAVSNLVKEVASADGHVQLIKFDKSKEIIFSQVNEIVSVLITQKNSYFLHKGLDGFTRKFYEEFENEIKNFKGNISIFEDEAKHLIKTKLPFMRHTNFD